MCRNAFFLSLARLLVVPVLVLASSLATGQNLTIKGNTNMPNTLVRLMCTDELLSGVQYVVAETFTDSEGGFLLKADVSEVAEAQLALGLERTAIVVAPNANYDITVTVKSNKNTPYFEREQPSVMINNADDEGLSAQLMRAETTVNNFFFRCFDRLYRSRSISYIDTLQNDIDKYVGEVKFKYVDDYIKYRKAAAVMIVGEKKAIAQYFDNQEILYNQPSYINAFSELFSGYFNNRAFKPQEFNDAFYSGYDAFVRYLANDDFLKRNPQLAEVVIVYELKRMYNENQYDKKRFIDYLNTMGACSEYKENRILALNMSQKLTELAWDSEAPSFTLKDSDGRTVGLDDFADKMVLLQFVDNLSSVVANDLSYLNEMRRQWNDNVSVITIATSDAFAEMVEHFEEKRYGWTLLDLGDNILLFEKYRVRVTPSYVIIKPQGRVGMAPAPAPENNLEFHLRRIHKYL